MFAYHPSCASNAGDVRLAVHIHAYDVLSQVSCVLEFAEAVDGALHFKMGKTK